MAPPLPAVEAPAAPRQVAFAPSAPSSEIDQWRAAVDSLRQSSPRHGKSLTYGRFLGFTSDGVKLAFPPDAAFHRTTVLGMSRAIVEAALAKHFGKPMRVVEETAAATMQAAPKSIAEVEASDKAVRETAIESKIRQHPAVRSVLKHLGGTIEHIQFLEPVTDRPAVAPAAAPDEDS